MTLFICLGKYSGFAPVSRPPIIERWTPPGCGPIHTLPFTREDEYIDRPYTPLLRERIFHISADSLAKLKEKVNSECNTTKISSLQSLSAVVWRCITRARLFSKDQETGCRLATNNRGRLSPPLSQDYFGKCYYLKFPYTHLSYLKNVLRLVSLSVKET